PPDLLPGTRIEGVDVRVVGAEVDAVAGQRDRTLDQAARVVVPAEVPGRRRKGVDVVRPVADDDELVGEEGRALGRPDRALPANTAGLGCDGGKLEVATLGHVLRRRDVTREEWGVVTL